MREITQESIMSDVENILREMEACAKQGKYQYAFEGSLTAIQKEKLKELGYQIQTGQQYGNWVVIQKAELQTSPGDTMWTCECQCNRHTIRDLGGYVLRNGISKSCGCLTEQLKSKAIMEKFGVKHPSQIGTKRNEYQLKAIESRENLLDVINEHFNRKPTTVELSNILGIDRASTMIFIHKYNLEDYIDIGAQNTSSPEREIRELFPDATFGNRKILSGLELDVYIPKAKLAIEFNGNYWHSELKKDEDYHQKKTIACAKQGIQLIHIFEYEWDDISTQKKILNLIKSKYNPKLNKAISQKPLLVTISITSFIRNGSSGSSP